MNSTRAYNTCPLPIVPLQETRLSEVELQRIRSLADRLLRQEPALAATGAFGPRVHPGLGPGPSLFYEDHCEIPLARSWVTEAYKYRIALLAGEGDLLAVSAPRKPAFESYLRDVLALGRIDVITVPPDMEGGPAVPLTRKLSENDVAMAAIVERARTKGSLSIVPYIGLGNTWRLAAEIATRSGAEVHVAAPPPRLTRHINNKLWFSRRVVELLGDQALPPSQTAFGPAALAARVARLARSNTQVVVKVPDSAGSIGNVVLAAEMIRSLDITGIRDLILGILETVGWRGTFPLMVGVWEAPVVMCLSIQTWIPQKEAGPSVIESMFMQTVIGDKGAFTGAEPARLTPPWRERLAHEATMLATLFQELGYFGRCSFDAMLVGGANAELSLHWVECNGRWGAVSIPMTLANRLTGDYERAPSITIKRYAGASTTGDFAHVLDQLDGHLFRPGDDAGVVLLTPGDALSGRALDFMVLERNPAAAKARVKEVCRILDAA